MNLKEVINSDKVNFAGVELSYFLIGLLSAFENRFQAVPDSTMKDISWKQFFAIICVQLCKEPPTIKELAEVMGSSHQNVKQILNKLEQKGFVKVETDEADRRKLRISLTEYAAMTGEKYRLKEEAFMMGLFEKVEPEEARQAFLTLSKLEANLMKLRAASEDTV